MWPLFLAIPNYEKVQMTIIEATQQIRMHAIPKSVVATIAEVPLQYVSDMTNGKTIPKAGAEKIIAAVADISAFVRFVNVQGFAPDLRNGEQLRGWIERWKAQAREAATA